MIYDLYEPELKYAQRGYKPFNGRKNHFCEDCIYYYKDLYDRGITTKHEFPFRYEKIEKGEIRKVITCTYDQRLLSQSIKRDDFDSDEDYEEAVRCADPVTWAYTELGWSPRWYQEEILACTSQYKAVRAGRRCGKTSALSVVALWYAMTNKNFEVLIICPYVAQVAKLMDNIRELIGKSPGVSNSVCRDVKSSPQVIEFNNGSQIRGFAAGGSSSGRSDQIRGQDADLIIMDEVDYIADADIEVIMAILSSNKNTRIIVSSTPTGLRSRLFNWTRDKDERWKEFWYISAESPGWDIEVEEMYRNMYSPGGFAREFLAEFGEEASGVFKGSDLSKCTHPYKYSDCHPDHMNCTYTIGVDWNKTTGTHLVVVERPKSGSIFYKIVEKKIIRKSEYTQLEGIKAIIELDKKWGASYIYCDAGYGHTQIEMLWAEDKRDPLLQYHRRVVPIEMASNIEILDPISKEAIKKPAKPLMVYLAAHQVERHRCVFPPSEDTTAQIVPEEIAFADIGILQQARNFKVTKTSPTGRETFSQDYEHTLTAWMLAVMAHLLEFGDYKKVSYDHYIGRTGELGGGRAGADIKLKDEFGRNLPPSQVENKLEQLRQERLREAEERKAAIEAAKRPKGWKDPPGMAKNTITPGTGSAPPLDETGYGYKMGQALIAINGRPVNEESNAKRWGRRFGKDTDRAKNGIFGRRSLGGFFKRGL